MIHARRLLPFLKTCLAAGLAFGAAATCAAQAAQGTQATAPQSAATASAGGFFQVLLGLVLVLALLAAIAWVLKRFNLARVTGNAPVKIVGGVSVGNRERVVVVEVADQWIVVGVAPGQVNALSTLARPENAPIQQQDKPLQGGENFATWLKQKIDKRNAE
ncbi:flagellar biosynthetic protein FliO [Janthinobacterium sp. 17J80-10]|uniref:flagellar biosynthetic protein FliO n=1 Tax=Janthinobacterium sp. 17J80-10 TaxID=2497863 RepID=UPI0010054538|nr:flagellar biosynthetic protein FliO [Janthinobacterium sp. 17J80-10]QAU34357.1 flagellar biosynthetic protein FliO [Janthinobacterium sp. 17J80-10]